MNWGEFLSELRVELNDVTSPNKWDDGLLYVYTRDGIWDMSQYLPRRLDGVVLVQDGTIQTKFALPTGFMKEIYVESPAGTTLERRLMRPGSIRATSNHSLFYHVDSGNLYLDADPGDDAVYLSYYGVHSIPAAKSDASCVLTTEMGDMEILKLYVNARVNERERNRQARLDRFKLGSGDRQDNPIQPEVHDLFARYYEKLAERTGGTIFLYRPRKYR
jgi:hypothetical protein